MIYGRMNSAKRMRQIEILANANRRRILDFAIPWDSGRSLGSRIIVKRCDWPLRGGGRSHSLPGGESGLGASFSSNRQSFCSARLERTATLVIENRKLSARYATETVIFSRVNLLAGNPFSSQVAVGFQEQFDCVACLTCRLRLLHFLDQRRHDVEQVSHYRVIGDFENRGLQLF